MLLLTFLRSTFMSALVPVPEKAVIFPSEDDIYAGEALESYVVPMAKWLADYLLSEEARSKWKE